MSSAFPGLAVPIPTLPEALMSMLLVGAPGLMRKGRREPPVTSRTKKLASLPAMSQVWAVKPPALVCSYRWAGVLPVVVCKSNTGVLVRSPTRPVLSTKIALFGALPVMVNGTVPAVISSIENLLAPPLAESFAVSCQSWLGKPAAVEVSSNLIRVLFSFSRIVSNPKLSLLTQSSPTQALGKTDGCEVSSLYSRKERPLSAAAADRFPGSSLTKFGGKSVLCRCQHKGRHSAPRMIRTELPIVRTML